MKLKNGQEEYIDCGGNCEKICPLKASEPNIEWSKSFLVSGGVYNTVIFLENPNFEYSISSSYILSFFDGPNSVLEKEGHITLFPTEKRFFFIPSTYVKNSKITKTFFKFTGEKILKKDNILKQEVFVLSTKIDRQETSPKLTITLQNKGYVDLKNLEVVAVLEDIYGNSVDVSKTTVDLIESSEIKDVFMTWQKPFNKKIFKINVKVKQI